LGVVSLLEALAIEEAMRNIANNPESITQDPTWGDVAKRYVVRLVTEGKGEKYISDTTTYLARFADFIGPDCLVSKISPQQIQDFQLALRAGSHAALGEPPKGKKNKPLKPGSCDRHLAALRAAWSYSVDGIPSPFRRVKLYNPENEITRLLSEEERTRLLEACATVSEQLYQIVFVALTTGLRKDNIFKLRRDEVDFEAGVIRIIQKRGIRHQVPMVDGLKDLLQSIPDNGTPYFWISPQGTPYQRDWRRPWEKAKKLAKILSAFRFHDLRHNVGTLVYQATGDLQAAQKLLGHRQLRTTQRYAHATDEYLKKISDKALGMTPKLRVVK